MKENYWEKCANETKHDSYRIECLMRAILDELQQINKKLSKT